MDSRRPGSCPSTRSIATDISFQSATRIARRANYLATVYNGIDLDLYPLRESGGDDLVFLGRIHPDKGVHFAIEVARRSGRRLIIAGIIQDEVYYREKLKPGIDGDSGALHRARGCRGKERIVRTCFCAAASEHTARAIRPGPV